MLSNILFLHPWILSGLLGLPVLWYLLRVTPPVPLKIILPTTRFLEGLIPAQQTPSHTPWWILLLRMIIAALVLFALAGPIYNPAAKIAASGPLRLVIDNSWASAQTWNDEMAQGLEALSQAARGNREVYLLTTAPGPEGAFMQGPLAAAQAESIVKGLKPLPWPADNDAAAKAILKTPPAKKVSTLWLSSGLDEGGVSALTDALQTQGSLTVYAPTGENLPVLLRRPEQSETGKLKIAIAAPGAMQPGKPVSVAATSDAGRVIDQESVTLKPPQPTEITFNTPDALKGQVAQFRLSGETGAGGAYILDERYQKKSVGIVGPADEKNPKPFLEARYYIERGLEPYADIAEGSPEDILKRKPAIIIMPDVGSLAPDTLDALEKWVRAGGLLLRFAGPTMAATAQNFLLPAPLRSGGRSLDGSMGWEKPQKLQPFPQTSPLFGIKLGGDITVRRQLLAEPSADLASKTWASLEDGTPLITGSALDKGMLVMIHTSAETAWSDLPLSGAFVEILKRVISLAGRSDLKTTGDGALEAIWVLDGNGQAHKPGSDVRPIPAADFDTTTPGPSHPPGLYGHGALQRALNLGDHIEILRTPTPFASQKTYGKNYERDLMPFILYAAFILLLADWLLMIILGSGFKILFRFAAICLCLATITPAHAETSASDIKYADGLYLAYIKTGDASLDALTQAGLGNLSDVLKNRTSVEPDGVVGLNPETDNLIFFPLIYWPITPTQTQLSAAALENIQNYLDHGGTILFDSRDGNSSDDNVNDNLKSLIGRLNIPALAPIQKDHVLLRSFYLLPEQPGRLNTGVMWVETQSAPGRDGVSSIIIGANDWAGAWAEGESMAGMGVGGTRQQELSFRFGVNALMYALTGNYKEDQVHVKNLLEKLGQ